MENPWSVSELTRAVSQALASQVGHCRVRGEVASFTAARSGHWYFDIKDERAVLSCVMFRGRNRQVRIEPRPGTQVILSGALDVYAPRGRYNLVVQTMSADGDGDLLARLEALKRRLAAEGLFEVARKRELPSLPRAVGVATSATGAALQDILKVLRRRFSGVTVYVASCRVQGREAPDEIVSALRLLNAHGESDVIICGRGGGSQEDLMAFNDERVARAIAESQIPVVSAVGHEVDVSIADLVADVRAATPSHAAELVVPEREMLAIAVDDLDARLRIAMDRQLRRRRERLESVVLRHPRRQLADARQRLEGARVSLAQAWAREQERRSRAVEGAGGRLQALSPVAVLGRGYAVVMHEGHAVRSASDIQSGDALHIRLHRGRAGVVVESVEAD